MDVSSKKDINEYLFYEFGVEGDEDQVSETWPFELQDVGSIRAGMQESTLYRFTDGQDSYYAVELPGLNFFPAAGMTAEHVQLQVSGSRWIAERAPIDLNTVRLGDDTVPGTTERRDAIVGLASRALGTPPASIRVLEGLFLSAEGTYLALVQVDSTNRAYVVGTSLHPHLVGFPEASDWRRLSLGVGEMIRAGELHS